ncbi:hypothetical protein MRB53_022096 [Persea americana]|uniref:Uncharacterized protein n=1 Tax=Persea americana TaxID=3435 RepID=A0ACC2L5Y9_PERAE|nr:hypothetical protein MRB53_022096 [Persea americana]
MVFADDGSIRSSSGSRLSYSKSRIKLGSINGSDNPGPMQPSFWDRCVPSRKRTSQKRLGPSLIQKLARDLSDILQKQEQSGLSNSLEEVLIYPKGKDSANFFETSLGSVLIKRPPPSAEGKSEGSSFRMENNNSCSNDAYVESQRSKLSSSAEVKYEEVRKAGEGGETMGDPKKDRAL